MSQVAIAGLPRFAARSIPYNLTLIIGASLFIAASAQVAIPLAFTPVPVTGQTFAVLLVGAALGSRRGTLAVLAYLAEGAMGLPVFAHGGAALPATGGYLLGFVVAAWTTGVLAERGWDRRPGTTLLAMTLGTALIFVSGIAWLSVLLGFSKAVSVGLLPFLPGAGVKICLATVLLPTAWKLLGRSEAARHATSKQQ